MVFHPDRMVEHKIKFRRTDQIVKKLPVRFHADTVQIRLHADHSAVTCSDKPCQRTVLFCSSIKIFHQNACPPKRSPKLFGKHVQHVVADFLSFID